MIFEFELFIEPTRYFQYDYILFDVIFLTIWLYLLIRNREWSALSFGLICGLIVYFIDAVWWWNTPIDGTYIREYWIDGNQLINPLGEYFWIKFSCDFMMCISYSLFAFPWMWIMFEKIKRKTLKNNFNKQDKKEIKFYTLFFLGAWMLIPFLSIIVPLNDSIVYTVRHMESQINVWIINIIIGYSILTLLYGTNIIKRKNYKIIGYVFIVGCAESFFMEFPLFFYRIRPTGLIFLLFEIVFLVNQGVPYLFIAYNLVIPTIFKQIKHMKEKDIELYVKYE